MAVCVLADISSNNCNFESENITDEEMMACIAAVAESLTIVNDHINEAEILGENGVLSREFSSFLFRESLFNYSDQLRYVVPRSFLIYKFLASQIPQEKRIDIDEELSNHYGFDLSALFNVTTALALWMESQNNEPDANFTIKLENFLEAVNERELFDTVIRSLSLAITDIPTPPDPANENDWLEYRYQQFKFRQKPIVCANETFFPIDQGFLKDLLWNGPYYLLLDAYGRGNERGKKFTRYLGYATELYCQHLARVAFGRRFHQLELPSSGTLGDFILEINPRWWIIFEVKAARPSIGLRTSSLLPADNPALDQMVLKALRQFDKRLIEFRQQNQRIRLTPIVITAGHFPTSEGIWNILKNRGGERTFWEDGKVDFPQVMDLESFEIFTACAKAGHRIGDFFRSKLANTWKFEAFQIFYHVNYFSSMTEPSNETLLKACDFFMNNLARTTFNQNFEPLPIDPQWKDPFQIQEE